MHPAARYSLAVVLVGLTVCLRLLLASALGQDTPFLLFLLAPFLTAMYGGRGPGLLAAGLSVFAVHYLFVHPAFSGSEQSLRQTGFYLLQACLLTELTVRWHKSEFEIRRQRDLLKTTLLSIGEGVIATDAEGKITLTNPVAERLTGYSRGEAAGRPLDDVFQIVNASTGERIESPIAAVLSEGKTSALANNAILLRKDGAKFPIDDSGAPILDRSGKIAGAILVFRDISRREKAEFEAEQSSRRLSSILDNISDGFVVLDRDCRIVFANGRAAAMCRKPKGGVLGSLLWEQFPEDLPLRIYSELRRALTDNVPVHFEEYCPPIGAWIAIDAYPAPDGLSMFMRDVTGTRRTTDQLRISNERFRRLSEANLIGIVSWNVDGWITEANDEYLRIAGYTREEFNQLGGINWRKLTPSEYKSVDDRAIQQALAAGVSDLYEKEYIHRNGKRVPIVMGMALLTDSTHDGVAFVMDITDRNQAEQRFRQLADNAPVLIWISGTDSLCNFFNRSYLEFTGRTMEQELGNRWAECVHPDDFRQCMSVYLASFEARREFRVEYRLRRHDGVYRWVLGSGRPLFSASGEFEGFIGSCIDITDRRMAEEGLHDANNALRRSNEDLRQFAYAASHDLQEPLRMVSLYSQLLAKRYKGKLDADADQFIEYTTSGANRMHALVHDLLAFTQAGNGLNDVVKPVDSNLIFEKTIAGIESSLKADNASVTHDSLPMVLVHSPHLMQLFQNLIGNSLKYRSDQPPAIHVSAKRDGNQWVFSVKDNGIGIHPKYHGRIFGIFKRLHRDEYPGTGIGLAICSKIVDRYGGRMWVESEVGKGANFFFTLPAVRD
jgi:PAS domain S-box-containing protein